MRAAPDDVDTALKKGGTLVYLDVSWQPLPVRLGKEKEITSEDLQRACETIGATAIRVDTRAMADTRMQNMALLGTLAKLQIIPGLAKENYDAALNDLLSGDLLKKNKVVFDRYAA